MDTARAPRLAAFAVLAASVVLAIVEIGRVGLGGWTYELAVAAAATALLMPIHLWHLTYGLRGERPPHALASLAAMAAIHLVALLLIGRAWSFMLAPLAVSGLVVLRPPWSVALLAACVLGPLLGDLARPDAGFGVSTNDAYLCYAVLFRAVIQFTLVWLVAATYQLAASRSALAVEATAQERARLETDIRTALDRRLGALTGAAAHAREALRQPGMSPALVAIDRTLVLARQALGDLREIVAEARSAPRHEAAETLARTARSWRSPIGRGLALHRAWGRWLGAHAVVLGFPLLMQLGAFGVPTRGHEGLAVAAWCGLLVLTLSLSIGVARDRPVRARAARWLGLVALSAGLLGVLGVTWETSLWFIGLGGAFAFRGSVAVVIAFIGACAVATYDVSVGGMTTYQTVWDVGYSTAISGLVVAGLWSSARLLPVVAQLEDARAQLAAHAVHTERHRLSRDLHDVLGQSLTAISLKGDLARRLGRSDPAAAAREVDALTVLAQSLEADMEAVARDERSVAFATEAAAAVELLRGAGIRVEADLQPGDLDAEASSLLGWAVREGATNILRHARASACEIRAVRDDGIVRLELLNDGAAGRRAGGTGLASLADRAAAVDGTAVGSAAGGRFHLRVELPVPS